MHGSLLLAADAGQAPSLANYVLLFLPLFLIWYFLVIRPQTRQRRKLQEMLNNLKTGDRVVTSGGIYGTITGFRDTVVQLQIANQVRIDVARSAITGMQPSESDGSGAKEQKREPAGKDKG